MRGDAHVRFGGRAEETDRGKPRHRASVRPYTYVHTHQGFLYLASVIDVFSRGVIGWAIASHMRAELVADALRMAIQNRGGQVRGVILHSDRGVQYGAGSFMDSSGAGRGASVHGARG